MRFLSLAAMVIACAATMLAATPANAVASPCPSGVPVRTDVATAGSRTYTLCSYDPGMGKMVKDLYVSVDGGSDSFVGSAPYEGITREFVAASETTLAIGAAFTGNDECEVQSSFDGGVSWTKTLSSEGEPISLAFSDDIHGTVTCRGVDGETTFVTSDGGHVWAPV